MNDSDPRVHLSRAIELFAAARTDDYARLRYVALDIRLTAENVLLEVLSSCYRGFGEEKFKKLYSGSSVTLGSRSLRKAIDEQQQSEFEIKNQVLPLIVQRKMQIPDYPMIDLDRVSTVWSRMSDHLHLLNRYDRTKVSEDRAARLSAEAKEALSYLSDQLRYPRYWVEFFDKDQIFFDEVVRGVRQIDAFKVHIKLGKLKNFTVIDVHHRQ